MHGTGACTRIKRGWSAQFWQVISDVTLNEMKWEMAAAMLGSMSWLQCGKILLQAG